MPCEIDKGGMLGRKRLKFGLTPKRLCLEPGDSLQGSQVGERQAYTMCELVLKDTPDACTVCDKCPRFC